MAIAVSTDRSLLRAQGRSVRHVVVRIAAPTAPAGHQRPAVNLAFILDRSGSMGGEKIARAKEAILRGLERLESRDRFSIVAFDNQVDVVVASTDATSSARARATSLLREIGPRGGTNLSEGWLTGCGQVADSLAPDVVGRAFLLTDGIANYGITDHAALCVHANELRGRGVSTSTFGIGADFDEALLGCVADAGGGTFRFIDTNEKIVEYIASELGEAADVVGRDVVLEIAVPAGVAVDLIGPYRVERSDAAARIALPDLVSGQEMEVVLKLHFPAGAVDASVDAGFRVVDRGGALGGGESRLQWRYADHAANDAQPRDRAVDRLVAQRYAASAREAALVLNRDGQYEEAGRRLRDVGRKIADYAGHDATLRGLVDGLMADGERYGRALDPMARKAAYFGAASAVRGKLGDGSSRRS